MSQTSAPSFERVFPRRELCRSRLIFAFVLSLISGLILCCVLFIVFLIVGLYESGGRLNLSASEFEKFQEFAKIDVKFTHQGDLGLGSFAWQMQERPVWSGSIAYLYRRIPLLQSNSNALLFLIIAGTFFGLLRAYLLVFIRKIPGRISDEIAMRLRKMLHRQSIRLEPGDIEDHHGADAVELFVNDVSRLRDGIFRYINRAIRYPIELTLLSLLALSVDWRLGLQVLIPLAGCWLLTKKATRRHGDYLKISQEDMGTHYQILAEGLRNSRTVRGYSMEDYEHEQFQLHLEKYARDFRRIASRKQWAIFLSYGLVATCIAALAFLIGLKILQPSEDIGTISLAMVILLIASLAGMYRPLEGLFQIPEIRKTSSLAADRIYRYLDKMPEVSQAVGAKFLQPLSKLLVFDSVVYRPDRYGTLLNNVNFDIEAGTSVAIVSLNPLEAKAAMLMLPRFIEPSSGRILIDDEDISWVTLESLRAETVFVSGYHTFFTGSVVDNIRCGDSQYSLQDVIEAAKKTHAHQFVQKLPNSYETILGQRGEKMDAGEAFRINLARAELRNPTVLVVEEPSAEMTASAKSLLDDAYQRLKKNRTMVFLPQRLSTVKRAEKIVLLNEGKVAAAGAHSELVKKSAVYRHWEYVRFNEFGTETTGD